MPPPCAIETCKRKSRALCHCCNKNLCPDHLKEHDDSFNSQMNPIVDELNATGDQLSKINLDNVVQISRQKLDKWRDDSHIAIDRFYEEKYQELQQNCLKRVDQKRQEIDQLKSKTTELVREQEATYEDISSLKTVVNDIKRDVNQLEEKGIFVATHPLTIDADSIYIEEWSMNNVDISKFSLPLLTIDCSDVEWPAMATNNHFLLVNQPPNLHLFDRDLATVKQYPWEYGQIPDMCWSSTLNSFIIITDKDGVFLVDENTASIKSIETIERKNWFSCTCSDATLFLTTDGQGSDIFQFNLLSSFQLIKHQNICQSGESIRNIAYNNGTLALIIQRQTFYYNDTNINIELRSSTMLDCLWSLSLNLINDGIRINRVCSLRGNEWLVTDPNNSHLLRISKDGKLDDTLTYDTVPYNAVLFGSNILAIISQTWIGLHNV